jgi:hypothetical protein
VLHSLREKPFGLISLIVRFEKPFADTRFHAVLLSDVSFEPEALPFTGLQPQSEEVHP